MSNTLYKSIIMDHVKNPRNTGVLPDFTHGSNSSNASCGDEIHLTLKVNEQNIIDEVGYDVHGCAVSLASMSMLSEKLKGLSVENALKISDNDMFDMMGIDRFTGRDKCVLLSRDALRSALDV